MTKTMYLIQKAGPSWLGVDQNKERFIWVSTLTDAIQLTYFQDANFLMNTLTGYLTNLFTNAVDMAIVEVSVDVPSA